MVSSGITGEAFTTLEGAMDPDKRVAWFSRPGQDSPDFLLIADARYERTELSGLDAPTPWVVYTPEESGGAFRRRVRELVDQGLDCDELFGELTTFAPAESVLSRGLSDLDPLTLFDDLETFTASADRIGNEDVRRTSTAHYRLELDEKSFADHQRTVASRDTAELPKEAQECLGSSFYPTGPPPHVDVWVDGPNRVRRLEQWQPLQIGPSPDARFLTRVDFFEFGATVEVIPPPPEDVTPAGAIRYPESKAEE